MEFNLHRCLWKWLCLLIGLCFLNIDIKQSGLMIFLAPYCQGQIAGLMRPKQANKQNKQTKQKSNKTPKQNKWACLES